MKRPEWAAAGTFPQAWNYVARQLQRPRRDQGARDRRLYEFILQGLSQAHVVTFDRAQVDALPVPPTHSHAALIASQVRAPFSPTYVSLGAAEPVELGYDDFAPLIVSGALIDGDGRYTPFFGGPEPRPAHGACWAVEDASAEAGWAWHVARFEATEAPGPALGDAWAFGAERAASALYLLECANVELVEAMPSRQERRAVERKGGRIAMTVRVQPPKKRPRSDSPPAQHPDWTHRWEVRGHFKHFPVGTKLADSRPEQLVDHDTLGKCRRIWCPPHVKGPESKPLVPKLRVVSEPPA